MRIGIWIIDLGKGVKLMRPSMLRFRQLAKKEISNSKILATAEKTPTGLKLKIRIKSRTPLRPLSKPRLLPLGPQPWTKASEELDYWAASGLPSKLVYKPLALRSPTLLKLITTQLLLFPVAAENWALKVRCAQIKSNSCGFLEVHAEVVVPAN